MQLLKSLGLILGTMAVFVVFGLLPFLTAWAVVAGLYLFSRLSDKAVFFAGWSWPQFLVTVGFGLGIPYALLLFTAGF